MGVAGCISNVLQKCGAGGGGGGGDPVLTSLTPNTGPGTGTTVVAVNGTGFLATSVVFYGSNAQATTFVSATLLRFTPGAGGPDTVPVHVETPGHPNTAPQSYTRT